MKVAVVGSRGLIVTNLEEYLPDNVTEIISGGARGVDASAREYAQKHEIKLTLRFYVSTVLGVKSPSPLS